MLNVKSGEMDGDEGWVASVQEGVLQWYERGHRELPWRRDRDAYRVLVSEMMLVQTTVVAAVPYFERFLERFPTLRALAEADEAEVLKAWEGLGYYRRARQLQEAARVVVERHEGLFPEEMEAVRALPGVGRYMAGAILSFAFDQRAAIVEANTQRVLARLLAWEGEIGKTATQKRLWEAAERLVPEVGAGQFNQGLMELGATVCTVKQPMCLICPVAGECRARELGKQDVLPKKTVKAAPLEVEEACALVRREGKVLLGKRENGGLWAGFWEFPTVNLGGADPGGRRWAGEEVGLEEGVRRMTGVSAKMGEMVKEVKYGVTKHRVKMKVYEAEDRGGQVRAGKGWEKARWIELERMGELMMGSAMRKVGEEVSRKAAKRGEKD